jgi:hypothetical protein
MKIPRYFNIDLALMPISSANINGTGFMLGESAEHTSNTGQDALSNANANLDGTGGMKTILTAASNGTLLKRVTIKSQVNTTEGMVRFFLKRGIATAILLEEIPIPATTKSVSAHSFSKTVEINFFLQSGDVLRVSTEKAEAIGIVAEGLDWLYP